MEQGTTVTWVQLLGAAGFGALIGWFVYYINRYRKGDVQFSDLTTVIGILGGAVVLSLFKAESDLFGAYGIGLFLGFFGYFASMLLLIRSSDNFNSDFLLDGRRKLVDGSGYYIPTDFERPPMDLSFGAPRAHAPTVGYVDAATLASASAAALEDARRAQVSADALQLATLNAQQTLSVLTQPARNAESPRSASVNLGTNSGD
jgi:hypothetical protein